MKKISFKKNTRMGFNWCFDAKLSKKKNTSVGSSAFQINLQWLDQPTLLIFLTFFEKIYKDWIKCKLSKSQIKWTGLESATTAVFEAF